MVPQLGHSLSVQNMVFMRSKPAFISGAKDGKIKIWSSDYRLIRTIAVGNHRNVALHPDESMIAVSKLGGSAELWSLNGKLIKRLPRMTTPIIDQLAFSPAGDYLVVCSTSNKADYCQLFGLNGERLGRIEHPLNGKVKNNIQGIGFSPDGGKIYLGIGQTVYVFNRDGKNIEQFNVTQGFTAAMAVSPDGTRIATADSHIPRKGSVPHTRLWTADGKLIAAYKNHASHDISFSDDSQWLISGGWENNTVLIIDRQGKKIHEFKVGQHRSDSPAVVALSPDKKRILTASKNFNPVKINVWSPDGEHLGNVRTANSRVMAMDLDPATGLILTSALDHHIRYYSMDGRLLKSHPANYAYPNLLAIAPNGRAFVSGGTKLTIWNAEKKPLATIPVHNKAGRDVKFTPDSKYLITCGIDGYVNIIAIDKEKKSKRFIAHDGKEVSSIAVHPDGKYFATGSVWERFRIWDMEGKMQVDFKLPKEAKPPFSTLRFMQFTPDGKELVVDTTRRGQEIRFYNMKGTQTRVLGFPVRNAYQNGAMAISPDGRFLAVAVNRQIGIWDLSSLKLLYALNGHPGWIDAMEFTADGRYLVSADSNGFLRIWNVESRQSYAMLSQGKEWIIYSEDGYFDASRYGGDLVSMVSGYQSYSVDQFAVFFNRPDILYQRLQLASNPVIDHFKTCYEKRLAGFNLPANQALSVPIVKILSVKQNEKLVEMALQTDARSKQDAFLQVYVNDVPVYAGQGKTVRGGRQKLLETIELSSGRNKIEVALINHTGIESLRTPVHITYKKKVTGDLYFAGLGVSKYRDTALNLKYADKDVTDMSRFLEAYKNSFEKIHRLDLVNEDVTRDALKKIRTFLMPSQVDDTVIFLVTGHGGYEYGDQATYFFLPHEADPDRLSQTAIPFDALEGVLSGIRPRKKLVFLDTCQSGEFDSDMLAKLKTIAAKQGLSIRSRKRLISQVINEPRTYLYERNRYIYNNLTRGTGATFFSSSLANESSLENDTIQNGIFTRSVIESLSNPATDTNKDGFISILELETHVKLHVAAATGGLQHPSIQRENIYQQINLPVKNICP